MNNKPSNYNVEHEINRVFDLFDGIRIRRINAKTNVSGYKQIRVVTYHVERSKLKT